MVQIHSDASSIDILTDGIIAQPLTGTCLINHTDNDDLWTIYQIESPPDDLMHNAVNFFQKIKRNRIKVDDDLFAKST